MKFVLLFLNLFLFKAHGQNVLDFNKRFVQSEDTWVAFPQSKDSMKELLKFHRRENLFQRSLTVPA